MHPSRYTQFRVIGLLFSKLAVCQTHDLKNCPCWLNSFEVRFDTVSVGYINLRMGVSDVRDDSSVLTN